MIWTYDWHESLEHVIELNQWATHNRIRSSEFYLSCYIFNDITCYCYNGVGCMEYAMIQKLWVMFLNKFFTRASDLFAVFVRLSISEEK